MQVMPSVFRRRASVLAVGLTTLFVGPAMATSFTEAVEAARRFDPQFRAAGHELEAARQGVPIARAGMLPQIALNYSNSDVTGNRKFNNALDQAVQVQVAYTAPQTSLSLRMPLFNEEARNRMVQAGVAEQGAEAQYRARAAELVDRVGVAFLQVLLAERELDLAQRQRESVQGQLSRAEQKLRRGEGTRIEEAQSLAALELASVKVLEAGNQLEITRRNLGAMTGLEAVRPQGLRSDYLPPESPQHTLIEWLTLAGRHNPRLQARQLSVEMAATGVKRQSAGHLPRVDLVASLARSENDGLSNLGQTSLLRSLGVQVNVPLFSGGGVSAAVKQALAEKSRAEEELRTERQAVETEIERHFLALSNARTRLAAYQRAVQSSQVAHDGANKAYEAGLLTLVDVLDAQYRLTQSQKELAQAGYDYLMSRIRLANLAGQSIEDLASEVDAQLALAATPKP